MWAFAGVGVMLGFVLPVGPRDHRVALRVLLAGGLGAACLGLLLVYSYGAVAGASGADKATALARGISEVTNCAAFLSIVAAVTWFVRLGFRAARGDRE